MNFTIIMGSTGTCTTTPKDPDSSLMADKAHIFLDNIFYIYLSFLGTVAFLCLIAT